MNENSLEKLNEKIKLEKKAVQEVDSLFNSLENKKDKEEKDFLLNQITKLTQSIQESNKESSEILSKINLIKPLSKKTEVKTPKIEKQKVKSFKFPKTQSKNLLRQMNISELEITTIKRLKRKEKKVVKTKKKEPNKFAKIANKYFSKYSLSLLKKKSFKKLERNLIKTNLQFAPVTYISIILFSTILSAIVGLIFFIFLFFFEIGNPLINLATGSIGTRILKSIWIFILAPIATFLFAYFYPSLEKKSIEYRINQELPFATIHMSAISGSMLEPSKIFSILISTKEYPYIEKEFTKLLNEINIYGHDLVTALRKVAENNPSKKLTDLFNSLATTITSGGNLPEFFNKRAESLLFGYRLEREKYTKTAETFMDIYISVVIAAPMILMLLLMMMKISGLGISLGSSAITLIMSLGVAVINMVFLTFLHLKQPTE